MKKKAQMEMMGMIIMAFVGIVAALALILVIAQNVGSSTNSAVYTNKSFTPAANGSYTELSGVQEMLSTPIVMNNSNNVTVTSNFTFDEAVGTNGYKVVRARTIDANIVGSTVNVSLTYGPAGYISNSGSRSVASLIVIFACLGVAALALLPTLKSGIMDMLGK